MSDKKLHERLMNVHFRMGQPNERARVIETDHSGLKKAHQFIRDTSEPRTWEEKLALKYYSRLFREFAIADLSRHEEQCIGFRWRIEKEVLEGKGQFICGAKGCSASLSLETFEVEFGYIEGGVRKQALVKVKLCSQCGVKLNYGRGEKEFKKIRSKRERDDHTADEERASKALKVVEAAAVLQLALGDGENSQGGVENPRGQHFSIEKDPDQITTKPQQALTTDEGVWAHKPDERSHINDAEGVDVDDFLTSMFQ